MNNSPTKHTLSYKNTAKNPTKTKRFIWWYGLVAIALFFAGLLIGRSDLLSKDSPSTSNADEKAAQASNTPKKAVMAVEAVTPQSITVEKHLSANGVIAAVDTAQVSAKVTGVAVERILVDVGDYVKAGQVLATLDTKALSEQVVQLQADLAATTAAKEHAQATLARLEPLLAIDAVSRQEVEAQKTALRQAQANITATTARLNTAKNQQKNANIIAPISGIISAKQAQVGALVTGAPLFSIIKNGALEWQAVVSPSQVQDIYPNQSVRLNIGKQTITAKVTKLSPVANEAREITVHVRLPVGAKTQAGSYQSGEFILKNETQMAIPMRALMNQDGYDYVWTLRSDDEQPELYQVVRTQVEILARQDKMAAVNLPTDALVVSEGVDFLEENDLVSLSGVNEPKLMGGAQ